MILSIIDTKVIDDEIVKFEEECEVIVELIKSLIYKNSRKPMNQYEYNKKYNFYTDRYETIKDKLAKVEWKKRGLIVLHDRIDPFINYLKLNDNLLYEFDEKFWYVMVNKAIVNMDRTVYFEFENSNQIHLSMPNFCKIFT